MTTAKVIVCSTTEATRVFAVECMVALCLACSINIDIIVGAMVVATQISDLAHLKLKSNVSQMLLVVLA